MAEVDMFSEKLWKNPPEGKCSLELGCRFPDGTLGTLKEFIERFEKKDSTIGKTWEDAYNFLSKSDIGLLLDCQGVQNFVEINENIEKKLEDFKYRIESLEHTGDDY